MSAHLRLAVAGAVLALLVSGCSLLASKSAGNCSVSRDEDAGTATIRCPDGTATVLHDGNPGSTGARGAPGKDGAGGTAGEAGPSGSGCTVADNGNGTKTVSCTDGTSAVIKDGQDGAQGAPGSTGAAGSNCTAQRDADAGVTTVSCDDGTTAVIHDGQPGATGPAGQSGPAGSSCTVTHDGGVAVVACTDGTSAVLPDASTAADGGATVTVEAPGPNCVHGGVAITSGTTTQYVCNVSPASVLSVVTAAASAISYRDAVLGGTVSLTGSDVVLGKGVCYDTAAGVTLSSTCVTIAGGTGAFGMAVSGLLPGTAYYVRAFATSASGTALGNEVSFQTSPLAVPTVSTDTPLNVSRNSARSGGNVSEWGGSAVLARGLCWSTSHAPTLADAKVLAGVDVGAFTADATGLTPGTTYYARAFATNAQGTGYGQEVAFTTTALPLPLLTTAAPTAVSYRSASASGSISSDEGSPVTARGVVYATHPGPTRVDSSIFAGAGIGTISASLTGLLPSTTYYLRAWAENAGGTAYGDERAFTTLSLTTPTLTTTSAGGISNTTANSGGNITDDGGTNVTARGVCWSTAPLPTLAGSCTSDGTGAGAFSSLIGSLTPNTTYYVRAYATNPNGTAFGSQVSLLTTNATPQSGLPAIGTGLVVSILSGTTATVPAYVSFDGGNPITARGICWGLTSNPTLSDNCSQDGTGIGTFTGTLTGLSGCAVTVRARAYASNANGTSFGNEITFTTGVAPTVTIAPVTNVTATSADASGEVTDSGGCPLLERGFAYSGFPAPSKADFTTASGATIGPYSATLSGLLPNTTVYVRSYATNTKGTSYGPTRTFTTLITSGLYLGQSFAGGVILALDSSGSHGLTVSTTSAGMDFASYRSTDYRCQCAGMSASTSASLGAGPTNTAAVVANCPSFMTNDCGNPIAEVACDSATFSGLSDWYLPSTDDFSNGRLLAIFGVGNLRPDRYYALSTWDRQYGGYNLPRNYNPRTGTATHDDIGLPPNAYFACIRNF